MKIEIVLFIIFVHWIADFVLQTDKQAKGKSKNWIDLLDHTLSYSLVWLIVGLIFLFYSLIKIPIQSTSNLLNIFYFVGVTFICHTVTDYFTSRLNSKLWIKGEVHNFFVSVGFDQFLHYAQLLITYKLLTNGSI